MKYFSLYLLKKNPFYNSNLKNTFTFYPLPDIYDRLQATGIKTFWKNLDDKTRKIIFYPGEKTPILGLKSIINY